MALSWKVCLKISNWNWKVKYDLVEISWKVSKSKSAENVWPDRRLSLTVDVYCWCVKDAEVDLQETAEYEAAKETLEETRAVARR